MTDLQKNGVKIGVNGVRNLAEELQKKSLKIKERVLGEAHPNAQIILENMKIAFYKWNPEGNFEQWLEENKKEQIGRAHV